MNMPTKPAQTSVEAKVDYKSSSELEFINSAKDVPKEATSELTKQSGGRKAGKRRAKTINDLRAYMNEMVEQENERNGDAACHCMVRPMRDRFHSSDATIRV
jgi:hypothetical protein